MQNGPSDRTLALLELIHGLLHFSGFENPDEQRDGLVEVEDFIVVFSQVL